MCREIAGLLQIQSRQQQQQHQALHVTMATKRPGVRPGAMLQIIWDAGQDRESVRTVGRRARSAWTAYMLDKHARRNSESGCGIYYETRAYVDIAKHAETPRYMAPPHTLDGQGARQDSMSSVSLREIGMAILQSMLN